MRGNSLGPTYELIIKGKDARIAELEAQLAAVNQLLTEANGKLAERLALGRDEYPEDTEI